MNFNENRYQGSQSVHYETVYGRINHPPLAMPISERNYCKVHFILLLTLILIINIHLNT